MAVDILKPIPCLDKARELKLEYRGHPIDSDHPLFSEPLVPISEYGVDGVSYYSQPNNATVDPVEGVTPNIFVRRSVAKKLRAANDFIVAHKGLAALFDGRIELYVRDGFRSPILQAHLHDTVIPRLVRTQNPDWTDEQIATRVSQVIAYPQWSQDTMPPHFTGGAVDLSLRSTDTGELIDTAHGKAQVGKEAIRTDFLEEVLRGGLAIEGLERALNARRVLHNVMTSEEVGGVSMENNPTETWHYSLYDQMWGILGGHEAAYYGVPPEIPEELQLTEIK
ncbi:hypothetical protein KA531_00565 [Candidatus Saccharibacteria bacterium]|nr:hypothetical protein [Candidatus Saccharibacteria bacterium]